MNHVLTETVADIRVREFLHENQDGRATRLPDGSWVIRVENVVLDNTVWSKPSTFIGFIVPAQFPIARPDCFVADYDLVHKDGSQPANAAVNDQPNFGTVLWFSYHPQFWDVRSTIHTYLRVIMQRLADPR